MAPKNTRNMRGRSNVSGRADAGSGPTKGSVPATASQTDHVPQAMSSPLDGRFSRGRADHSGGLTQPRGSTAGRLVPPKIAPAKRAAAYVENTRDVDGIGSGRGHDERLEY